MQRQRRPVRARRKIGETLTAQAIGALAGIRSSRLIKVHRAAVLALAFFSVVLIVKDALADWQRADLLLELLARTLMVVLAVVCSIVTKGNLNTRLLMWGLILLSFDVYWQTAYGHGGVQWAAMFVKYAAVPAGIGFLLRFCANFGDGDYRAIRAFLYDWAPIAAAVVGAAGFARGISWIQGCEVYLNSCMFFTNAPVNAYNAYMIADAAFRFLTIVAALIGLARSSAGYRSQLALVVCACVMLACGTILDFVARIPPAGSEWRSGLIYLDAATTLLFPVGLTVALFAKQLFDVNVDYVLRRTLALTIATGLTVALFAFCDALLHTVLLDRITQVFPHRPWLADAGVGFVLLLSFHKIEEKSLNAIDQYILPDRKHRLEHVRSIGEELLQIGSLEKLEAYGLPDRLKAAARLVFVDVFLRDAGGSYKPRLWNEPVEPRPIGAAAPIVTKHLSEGRRAVFDETDWDWPNAQVAFPMMIGSELYGMLVCGRKYSDTLDGVYDAFDAEELRQLELLARQTGTVMYALHASV